ncbi:DUF961 family protein [Lentzea albida]|uniref:DUF961 domain-containing protein n=1 Tax=Lentzea albida TaxID=65499 RepID=A0A1H9XIT1_9PSEU|nr:DUF961 family protein [Lentzea albida]SES45951.1 protein of unknown function [Lentzea albida]
MKNVVIDTEKTLGDLFYLGCDEVYEYKDNRRTEKVIGYNYNVASSVQGDAITIKVMGDKKEFNMMEPIEAIGIETNIWGTASKSGFVTINYSLTAYDLKKKTAKVGV